MKPGMLPLLAALVFVLTSCGGDEGLPRMTVSDYSEKTVEAGIPLQLDIDCGNGDIEVYSWNKKEVKLEITRTVQGREDRNKLLQRLDDFKLDIGGEGDRLSLKSSFKGGGRLVEGRTDLRIYVPKKTASFKLVQKGGRLHFLDDFNGDVSVEADRLDLDINRLEGKLTCDLDRGDVNISSGELGDGSSVLVENGNIRIKAAFEESGSYNIRTGFGILELSLPEETNAVFDAYGVLEAADFSEGERPSRFRLESKAGRISIRKFGL